MLKLIKLEWKKNRIGKYIRSAAIMTVVLEALVLAMIFTKMTYDESTGMPDMTFGDNMINMCVDLLSGLCYIIFSSVMLSAFIVSAYRNKTMSLMFSYPIKRQKILASQMLAVWIFNTAALIISSIVLYGSISVIARFVYTPYPILYDMTSPAFYIQLAIRSAVNVSISFIALFVGMAMRSSKATIITSFLLVSVTQGSVGDFTLSNNFVALLLLAVVSIVFAVLSVVNAETRDLL